MKTPLTYYGGKQSLVPTILPMIPRHETYCEPFCGGGAVFWAKPSAKSSVLNDRDGEIMNFWHELRTNTEALCTELDATLCGRAAFDRAKAIRKHPEDNSPFWRAWATAVLSMQSIYSKGNSFNISAYKKPTDKFKEELMPLYREKLKNVTLETRDALKVIDEIDKPVTFIYCDPPYVGSECSPYKGSYTQEDFDALLERLSKVRCNFLLSSYPNGSLTEACEKYGWHHREIDMVKRVAAISLHGVNRKTECLTWNYQIERGLFDEEHEDGQVG